MFKFRCKVLGEIHIHISKIIIFLVLNIIDNSIIFLKCSSNLCFLNIKNSSTSLSLVIVVITKLRMFVQICVNIIERMKVDINSLYFLHIKIRIVL